MMEYYSAIRKDEIMPFVATWMDLEGTIPNEISQMEETNTIWFYSYAEYEKLIKNKNKWTNQTKTNK